MQLIAHPSQELLERIEIIVTGKPNLQSDAMSAGWRLRLRAAFAGQSRPQSLVLLLCLLFGLALILNTETANEGVWFWYAVFLRQGQHLYSGMHLALQPLFALETEYFQALLGTTWLASRVPAVLHLFAYCTGLWLVVRASRLTGGQKAIILACAFFVSIDFVGNRFDDYHVLADCFEIYSFLLLLALQRASLPWRSAGLAAALGLLSGLALMTRPNDGAALFVGVALCILFLAPARRLLALALFALTAALTVVFVVRLTGDSLHDWASNSLFKAAASKGGAGHVLAAPVQLPLNAILYLGHLAVIVLVVYVLGAVFVWTAVLRPLWRDRKSVDALKLTTAAAFLLLPFPYLGRHVLDSVPIIFPALGAFLACLLACVVVFRFLRSRFAPNPSAPWDPREALLLIPLGQLASGSMSTGGSPLGLNTALATLLLLLPIAGPIRLKRESTRAFAFALLTFIAITCAAHKYRYPYQWHSYTSHPLFVDRQWYHHPDYGPILIERDNFAFIQPICNAVQSDGAQQGLLSLPFPYPNYFCAIPPWHGYVQTFFDLAGEGTIQSLIAQLQTAPPKWIVYQRQLYNMGLHEQIFNHGRPLPHRALDQFIEDKIATGAWQPVYTSTYGSYTPFTNQWILIRTRP